MTPPVNSILCAQCIFFGHPTLLINTQIRSARPMVGIVHALPRSEYIAVVEYWISNTRVGRKSTGDRESEYRICTALVLHKRQDAEKRKEYQGNTTVAIRSDFGSRTGYL
jgi:hypothetical protein